MTTSLARRTDPHTSHTATRAAYRSTAREDVLLILRKHGPLHDRGIEVLHDAYVQKGLIARKSAQRLRTARAELVDAGLVREHTDNGDPAYVLMPSGYTSTIWEATNA